MNSIKLSTQRINIKVFIILFLVNFFSLLGTDIIILMTPYIKNLGATNLYTGIFSNMPSIILVFFFFAGGRFVNNTNRRFFIILSYLIASVSMFCSFFLSTNLLIIMILRLFNSASFGIGFTLLFNLLHSNVPDRIRNGAVAIYGLSGISAFPLSAWINEFVYNKFPDNQPALFIIALLCTLVALLLMFMIKDQKDSEVTKPAKMSVHFLLFNKELYTLMLINIVFGGAFGILSSYLPNFSIFVLNISSYSFFFTSFAIISIIVRVFLFKLLDTLPRNLLNIVSLMFILSSFILILTAKSTVFLLIAGIFYGLGHSVLFPTLSTSFVMKGDKSQRDLLSSGYIVYNTFGMILFSSIFGFISDFVGLRLIFVFMAFAVIISIVSGLIDYKRIF